MLTLESYLTPGYRNAYLNDIAMARKSHRKMAALRVGISDQAFLDAIQEYKNQLTAELILTGQVRLAGLGTLKIKPSLKYGVVLRFQPTRSLKTILRQAEYPITFPKRVQRKPKAKALRRGVSLRSNDE